MIFSYNKILITNGKEWTPDVYNNMDESQKSYAEQKKPDTKTVHTVWFYLY